MSSEERRYKEEESRCADVVFTLAEFERNDAIGDFREALARKREELGWDEGAWTKEDDPQSRWGEFAFFKSVSR